jgi:hypothetical protein
MKSLRPNYVAASTQHTDASGSMGSSNKVYGVCSKTYRDTGNITPAKRAKCEHGRQKSQCNSARTAAQATTSTSLEPEEPV